MANGNFAGGGGTLEDPYLIEDAFDLDAVRNDLTASYKLISDIDLNISPFNEGEGWIPIGDNSTNSDSSRFTGSFDGNNKIIFNLFINRPGSGNQGLFGYTNGSTIENVGIENIDITGNSDTGGLVGRNYNSSIIRNSYSTGSVTGSGSNNTGGLVGVNHTSSIINSYSTGSVTGSGSNNTGGLVGNNYSSSIINSYSTGSVTGSGSRTGGLVGYNYYSSVVRNSYSTGSVTGGNNTGGLVGYNANSSVINSYWDKETSGYTTSAGGIGLTTQEMQTAQTFIDAGWHEETLEDGTPVWILSDGSYPLLWHQIDPLIKYLIKDKEIKYYNDGWHALTDSNESNFFEYGMDDLSIIPISAWNELGDDIEILQYREEAPEQEEVFRLPVEEIHPIQLLDNPKLLVYTDDTSATSSNMTIEGVPEGQLVFQEGDMDIRGGLEKLQLTVSPNIDESLGESIRIILSHNQGESWYTFSNGEWQDISPDKETVKEQGITPDVFNALTQEEIDSLIGDSDTLRFSYYIEQGSLYRPVYVEDVTLTGKPVATETPIIEDIQIEYDELTIEGRLKELERTNAINMAKLNFKANSLVKAEKYKLHDLVIDTFESDSMKTIESEEVEEKEILAYKVEPNYNHYAHHYDLKDVLNYHIDTSAIIGKQHLYDRGETYGEWIILEQSGNGNFNTNEDHIFMSGNGQRSRNNIRVKNSQLIDFSEINNIHADYEGYGNQGGSRVGINIVDKDNNIIKSFEHVSAPYGSRSYPREIRTFDVSDIQEEGYICLNIVEGGHTNTSGGNLTLYELWTDDVIESSTFLNVDHKWYSLSSLGELTEVDKTSNLIEINSSIDNFALHHDAVMSFIEDKEIKELVFVSNANYSLYFLSGDFIVSAYDSSDGSYKGVSVIQSESEKVLENLKRLWIVSDYEDCTFEYSLDNGETWSSIESDEIKNIENQNGDGLVIKVYLPNETSVLRGLAVGWA